MATNWLCGFPSAEGFGGHKIGGLWNLTGLVMLVAGLGLLCLGVTGCDIPDSELIGTYLGCYKGGRVEVFHIREDGTFDQTLLDGKTVYRNQGTWAFDREPGRVEFSDIMSPFQAPGEPLWMPRFLGGIRAGWDRRRGLIEFDPVISIRKVSSEVPPKDPDMPRMRDVYREQNTGEKGDREKGRVPGRGSSGDRILNSTKQ